MGKINLATWMVAKGRHGTIPSVLIVGSRVLHGFQLEDWLYITDGDGSYARVQLDILQETAS